MELPPKGWHCKSNGVEDAGEAEGKLLSSYQAFPEAAPTSLATSSKSGLNSPAKCLRQDMMNLRSSLSGFFEAIVADRVE